MRKDDLVYWECEACGDQGVSSMKERHKVDKCKCGKSSVDAEEFYIRTLGPVRTIKKEQYKKQ